MQVKYSEILIPDTEICDFIGIREENIFPICQCCETENHLHVGDQRSYILRAQVWNLNFSSLLATQYDQDGLIGNCGLSYVSPVSLSLRSPGSVSVCPPGSFGLHFHHSFFWTRGGFLDVWIWDDRRRPVSNWKYPGICPVFNNSQTSHNLPLLCEA